MSTSLTSIDAPVQLTDNAAKRIAYLISKEENSHAKLRISVLGGGCSGFQYHYEFVDKIETTDMVIEKSGATVLIDDVSLPLLTGCTVDYVETLESAMFVITNPNASSKCGCGNSFAL